MTGPWFHTGDMAVWDEDSYIHIVDRKKEIIISGGENISSIEVERAIFSHPAVFECAVVAAPSDKWGEVPAAIVVLQARPILHRRRNDDVSGKAPRQIQAAAHHRIFRGAATQNRHRQDPQDDSQREILGRQREACTRLTQIRI